MYKSIAGLAAAAAVFVAFHNARAVEDPPQAHLQLVEVEQQTPYLESFAGVTAGTATVSIIRRVSQAGTSSQSYAQFDNHNGDGSRASFPLDVEDGDTYGVSASLVKGPNFGIVQLFVDGRQLGGTYDLYAPAITVHLWGLQAWPRLGWLFALAYAVCMALRLARFNARIDAEDQPHKSAGYLTGVPAPAGAGVVLLPILVWLASDGEWSWLPTSNTARIFG